MPSQDKNNIFRLRKRKKHGKTRHGSKDIVPNAYKGYLCKMGLLVIFIFFLFDLFS